MIASPYYSMLIFVINEIFLVYYIMNLLSTKMGNRNTSYSENTSAFLEDHSFKNSTVLVLWISFWHFEPTMQLSWKIDVAFLVQQKNETSSRQVKPISTKTSVMEPSVLKVTTTDVAEKTFVSPRSHNVMWTSPISCR